MFFVLKACEPKQTLNTMYVLRSRNGRVACTPTQPVADGNNLSPRNEMHFTNGIPME